MSLIEIVSFMLIFNFFQFLIINMFSELFWSAHRFNRTHQNLFVTNLLFSFVEIINKALSNDILKKNFFKFLTSKNTK